MVPAGVAVAANEAQDLSHPHGAYQVQQKYKARDLPGAAGCVDLSSNVTIKSVPPEETASLPMHNHCAINMYVYISITQNIPLPITREDSPSEQQLHCSPNPKNLLPKISPQNPSGTTLPASLSPRGHPCGTRFRVGDVEDVIVPHQELIVGKTQAAHGVVGRREFNAFVCHVVHRHCAWMGIGCCSSADLERGQRGIGH